MSFEDSSLIAGELNQLSPHLYRILAPNPSKITGPGTNTYLVVGERIGIIDPGPNLPAHLEAIKAAVKKIAKPISHIVVTHTHHDHSPAVAPLAEYYGVPKLGMMPPDDKFQDKSFQPDQVLADGDVVEFGGCTIKAVHTPGHVSNHLCYWLEPDNMMLTGDHLLQGSTVVIIPPEGSMMAYIESLHKLKDYPMDQLAPGHGETMGDCQRYVDTIIAHRLMRENKVIDALKQMGKATIPALTPVVYDDTPSHLHSWAQLSLHAHLIKLQQEQRASLSDEDWQLI